MKKKLLTFVLTGLLVFSATGIVSAQSKPIKNSTSSDPTVVSVDPLTLITIEEASKIALGEVPDSTLVSIKLDCEDTLLVYECELQSGTVINNVKINAATGEVLVAEQDNDVDENDQCKDQCKDQIEKHDLITTQPSITFENAVQVALDSVTNGTFVSIELDNDNSLLIFKVSIRTGTHKSMIKIDATTGEIIKSANDNKPHVEKKHVEKPEIENHDDQD